MAAECQLASFFYLVNIFCRIHTTGNNLMAKKCILAKIATYCTETLRLPSKTLHGTYASVQFNAFFFLFAN